MHDKALKYFSVQELQICTFSYNRVQTLLYFINPYLADSEYFFFWKL